MAVECEISMMRRGLIMFLNCVILIENGVCCLLQWWYTVIE